MRDTQREPRNDNGGNGGEGGGPSTPGDAPKFGRLLLVLAFALVLVVALTFGSEAYFS